MSPNFHYDIGEASRKKVIRGSQFQILTTFEYIYIAAESQVKKCHKSNLMEDWCYKGRKYVCSLRDA